MKKAVSVFLIILGLVFIMLSLSNFTGAVIGESFKMNYLAFFGVLLFILGIIILLTSAPLEEIVENESPPQEQNNQQQIQHYKDRKNKSLARRSAEAVYGVGRWFTRRLYYGFAAPAVSATVKTGKEVGREAAAGIGGVVTDFKNYKEIKKQADAYRAITGFGVNTSPPAIGWKGKARKVGGKISRVLEAPDKNVEYAEKYRELDMLRDVLSNSIRQRIDVNQAYHMLEGLRTSTNPDEKKFYNYAVGYVRDQKDAYKENGRRGAIQALNQGNAYYDNVIKQAHKIFDSRDPLNLKDIRKHQRKMARKK